MTATIAGITDGLQTHLQADYLSHNRFAARLKVKGSKGKKKSDLDLQAEEALRSTGKGRLERLNDILNGIAVLGSEDGDLSRYVYAAANSAARKETFEEIKEDEVYDWMKKKRFPGSIREATE